MLYTYTVTTENAQRTWEAEDSDHAAEQHEDAFAGEPGETILSIVRTFAIQPRY